MRKTAEKFYRSCAVSKDVRECLAEIAEELWLTEVIVFVAYSVWLHSRTGRKLLRPFFLYSRVVRNQLTESELGQLWQEFSNALGDLLQKE